MPTYEEDLIKRARELQRLATKRRKLKRQLKQVTVEMRHARKLLKAVQAASEGRRPDVMPNRLDGGASGFAMPAAEPAELTSVPQDTVEFVEGLTSEEPEK